MKFKFVFVCMFLFGNDNVVKPHNIWDLEDNAPFYAVVSSKYRCSGVLISENYVIVWGSCVYGTSKNATVYLGFRGYPTTNLYEAYKPKPDAQIISSDNIIVHENFTEISTNVYLNNIALIKLHAPTKLNIKVQPGKLSRQESHLNEGKYAHISGWKTNDFKVNKVEIVKPNLCHSAFSGRFSIKEDICMKSQGKSISELHLMSAARVDDQLIGLVEGNTSCYELGPCYLTVHPFAKYLGWMSDIMQVPIEDFTGKSQEEHYDNHQLTKIEDSINEINETVFADRNKFKICESDLINLNIRLKIAVEELQTIKMEQNTFKLSLNEGLRGIRTEDNMLRIKFHQDTEEELKQIKKEHNALELSLNEEVRGIRVEANNLRIKSDQKTQEELQKIKKEQNAFEKSINEELRGIRTEDNNLRTKSDQSTLEELKRIKKHTQEDFQKIRKEQNASMQSINEELRGIRTEDNNLRIKHHQNTLEELQKIRNDTQKELQKIRKEQNAFEKSINEELRGIRTEDNNLRIEHHQNTLEQLQKIRNNTQEELQKIRNSTLEELQKIKKEQNAFAVSLNGQIGGIRTEVNNLRNKSDPNTAEELQQLKIEQNIFALSLNKQIGDIKIEINNFTNTSNQNMLNLHEVLNEVTNSSAVQNFLNNSKATLIELNKDLQAKVDKRIVRLEEQSMELINTTRYIEIGVNDRFWYHKQEIMNLYTKIIDRNLVSLKDRQELNEQFGYINATVHNISIAQNILYIEMEGGKDVLKTEISMGKVAFKKLQEKLDDACDTVYKNKEEDHLRIDEIEKVIGEHKNTIQKHLLQETKQIDLLWGEMKSMNNSVNKMYGFIYNEPLSN